MANASETSPRRKKRGPFRQGALVALGVLAVWLTGAGTYQVLKQSLWPEVEATAQSCRSGTVALYAALERARAHAADQVLNERRALLAFRADLAPVWQKAGAIVQRCKEDRDSVALRALRSVELLRYAEERAIRLSAVDLTHLRRSTPRLVHALATKPK